MSRILASIQQVQSISPIEGKDKIKLAKILGWNVIVDSTIKEGEEVVFIEVDAVLPEKPEFEFLRKRCYSESQGGYVIKTMKMGGVISQGIVFHINDVFTTGNSPNTNTIKNVGTYYPVGYDVTELLQIKQREDNSDNKVPQKKKTFLQSLIYRLPLYKYFRNKFKVSGDFPTYLISKSDETRIQSLGDKFLSNHIGKTIVITEKIEGQSATYLVKKVSFFKLFNKYVFKCYSRNMSVDKNHVIYKYAIDNNVKEKMIELLKDRPTLSYVALQGEMAGGKIQGNIYNLPKHEFFIFKIAYNNKEMCFKCLKEVCDIYSLTHVPVIAVEILTETKNTEYWAKISTDNSLLANVLREGVVVRSIGLNKDGFTDFSFKAVSPEYCLNRGY
jgi:hypothetical protein